MKFVALASYIHQPPIDTQARKWNNAAIFAHDATLIQVHEWAEQEIEQYTTLEQVELLVGLEQ